MKEGPKFTSVKCTLPSSTLIPFNQNTATSHHEKLHMYEHTVLAFAIEFRQKIIHL